MNDKKSKPISKVGADRKPAKKKTPAKKRAGRPKGTQKTGGRKKGTPNKNSWNLRTQLEDLGFDPVAEMVRIYNATRKDADKFQRLMWIFKYTFPQLKESEIPSNPVEEIPNPFANQSTDNLLSIVKKK